MSMACESAPACVGLVVASPEMALANPIRRRIYSHLQLLPGDHFRSIARHLGLTVGQAQHHLGLLLRHGLVRESADGARSRYYVRYSGSSSEMNALYEKHWAYRDLRLRILMFARSSGPVRPSAVAVALGISRQLASYHLAQLVDLGLVVREDRAYRAVPAE